MQLHDNALKRETLRLKINMKRLTAQFAFSLAVVAVAVKIIIYMVDTMRQNSARPSHFACKENEWPRHWERDFYQINKMERIRTTQMQLMQYRSEHFRFSFVVVSERVKRSREEEAAKMAAAAN